MTIESFQQLIGSNVPVLIDFWAPWCGPCIAFNPILEEVKAEFGDRIHLEKINVDESLPLVEYIQIMGVPTLMIYYKGNEYWNAPGTQTKSWLIAKLNDILENKDQPKDH